MIRTLVLKHLSVAEEVKREQERIELKKCHERSDCKELGVEVIERKEVRGDDPIKYFLSKGVRSTF